MKISTKGRYGLRALIDLARSGGEEYHSLAEISKKEGLSYRYLESLFRQLKKASLVTGASGAAGGYKLTREPGQITVRAVLETLENDLSITDRSKEPGGPLRGFLETEVWDAVDRNVLSVLDSTTLKDLMEQEL